MYVHAPSVLARAGIVHDEPAETLTLPSQVAQALGLPERVRWTAPREQRLLTTHPRYHLALVLHHGGVHSAALDRILAEHRERSDPRSAADAAPRMRQAAARALLREACANSSGAGAGAGCGLGRVSRARS